MQIQFPDTFWSADKLETSDGIMKFPLPSGKPQLEFNWLNSCGLSYEAQCVRECINAGELIVTLPVIQVYGSTVDLR